LFALFFICFTTVGGPLDTSCRLQGLLDTVINRGIDLQKELDENTRTEESLRREIAAELKNEPSHPIVTDAPKIERELAPPPVESKDDREPTTPTEQSHDGMSSEFAQTPDCFPHTSSAFIIDGLRVGENGIADFDRAAAFPFTPNSIDNADLGGCGFNSSGLPGYRRNTSLDETDFYGCGAAAFLGGHVRLFADTPQPSSPIRLVEEGIENRRRVISSDDGHLALSPTLTSSFDTIDFRTGLSGHRGLNNSSKKQSSGYSPTPRSRMMMSEHRGIGRVRGPLNRSATSNTPSPPYNSPPY